jgi:integrase
MPSQEATEKIIAACADAEWRLIVALARYGGLRTPSETFALTCGVVDWERERIRVPSPKTACHAGRESRMLPLFPELRPHLEAIFDEAKPGTIHVIAEHRAGGGQVVGASSPEHEGKSGDGIDPGASPPCRCGMAGQFGAHRGPALSPSDRCRL